MVLYLFGSVGMTRHVRTDQVLHDRGNEEHLVDPEIDFSESGRCLPIYYRWLLPLSHLNYILQYILYPTEERGDVPVQL